MAQYICRYRKGEELRWIGHLDLKRTLERAMRRARLPLELSQGHHPHPKLSYGPPLSLGVTGEAEVFAVHLREALRADELQQRLNAQFPPGLEVTDAWVVPGYRKKETFGDIDLAEYLATVRTPLSVAEVHARIGELLAQEELVVTRRGEQEEQTRTVDVRPMLLSLRAEQVGEDTLSLQMRLRTGSHGGARPQEVLALLGLDDPSVAASLHRVATYVGGELPPETAAPRPKTGGWRRWGRPRRG